MSNEALLIVWISVVAAAALGSFFLLLLFRRWRIEHREASNQNKLAEITRNYLQRVGGFSVDGPDQRWPAGLKLAAISHLHLLLRGGERERLMQMAELDGLLNETLQTSKSRRAHRRIDAIRLLQQFGSEACVARLRELMARDRNPTVRVEAAFALASIDALPPPRELIRILGLFDRNPRRLDSALLRATAKHYCDHLQRLLNDPMPHWRRALIVDALGWSEDPSVLETLARAGAMESAELRSAALRAAARLGHPSVAEWVIPLLHDPVAFVRVQAANCCAVLGLASARPDLVEIARDEDLWVRLRAAHALNVLGGDMSGTIIKGNVA
ncbi:HEAT repeat domain-containing protein [Novosphingobium aquiterrae]|uniref:HEAT repeat domain-containing protein n=1 Tax=Novosphingobium aquiterrae TaxID=624388 RepID=A0ABV6PGL3_9SPHN